MEHSGTRCNCPKFALPSSSSSINRPRSSNCWCQPSPLSAPTLRCLNLRGLAFLRLQKGAEAAAEFQKILDHKGANWGMYYSLSYLGLGRTSALAGNTAKAGKAFQDFFALWKDIGRTPVT